MSRLTSKFTSIFRGRKNDTSRFVPDASRDIFLVTYPRSGTTWISCIAAELMFRISPQSLSEIDFVVPDIHTLPMKSAVPVSGQYLVKSHLPFTGSSAYGEYRRVIYLIRDPRDVMLSYHRFLRVQIGYKGGLTAFARDWVSGRIWPSSWQEHVNSWLAPAGALPGVSLELFRYEDFIENPLEATIRLSRILGAEAPRSRIDEIIADTHPNRMRARERNGNEGAKPGLEFIGSASSGVWKQRLDGEMLGACAILEEYASSTMQKLGYARGGQSTK